MEAFNFISSLLPSLKKHGILEDVSITLDELRNTTIPAYKVANELFKGWKFKSKNISNMADSFSSTVHGKTNDNMIRVIYSRFDNVVGNLEMVEKTVSTTFNNELASEALTYTKVSLIQFVELGAFVSRYSRKLLSYVYLSETAEYDNSDTSVSESLSPAEIEWLGANFISFCNAVNILSGDHADTKQALAEIPEIVVTSESTQLLKETVGIKKIDPFNMGFIPVWLNPVYHIGMMYAEWQANRYKSAQEELKMLQLRHLYLSRLMEGKNDAALKKQLDVVERRVADLNYRIAKMEKQ